jgi:hypothetical protein
VANPTETPQVAEGNGTDESPSNDPLEVALIFTAPDGIVALAAGPNGSLFVRTSAGEISRIGPDGASEQFYSGLAQCSFSRSAMAALPNGDLVLNDCRDNQDTLIRIDPEGNATTLLQLGFDQSVVSIASDAAGNLYLGTWLSEGNIALNFNPTHLGGADHIFGSVSILLPDNQLTVLRGGVPLALATAGDEICSLPSGAKAAPSTRAWRLQCLRWFKLVWVGMSIRLRSDNCLARQPNSPQWATFAPYLLLR